jgi:CelD/BcsL family acetyltransferase involved in cellulose biosynthesis
MRIEVIAPHELGQPEVERWRALQAAQPALGGAFLAPDFAQLIGGVRRDGRVAIISDGEIAGFFAVQRLGASVAVPLGAPISDLHGIVGSSDIAIDLPDLCRAFKVGRLDFSHVPAEQAPFAGHALGAKHDWVADLSSGSEPYFAKIKKRRPQFLYQLSRTRRKFEREQGALVFTPNSARRDHLETLLNWKDGQLKRTHQPAVWRVRWVREAIERSFAQNSGEFGGHLFTLTCGDQLIAANYCLANRSVLNGMLMAHESSFSAYSPGLQLARQVLQWAGDAGFSEFAFGLGDQMYKRQLSTGQRALVWGWAGKPSVAHATRSAQYAMRRQIERIPNVWIASLPGRAMRRFDVYRSLLAPSAPGRGAS